MALCQCGCGNEARRTFLPGHDSKLRSILEHKVGGLLVVRELIAASVSFSTGKISEKEFCNKIQLMIR
jgi:hypothetical protein